VDLSLCDSVLEACEGEHERVVDVHTNAGELPADPVVLAKGTYQRPKDSAYPQHCCQR
jgi:hypothetical protein